MISFKQFLMEMPTTQFKLLGQWDPNSKKYGYSQKDIGILTSPKAINKIHKSWSNSKNDFEFYFLRSFKASKHIEVGEVSSQWVKDNLEIDVKPNPEAITIIFTQNTGTEKIMFTAWAIAHRLGHAIRKVKEFEIYFYKELEKDFIQILKSVYQRGKLEGMRGSYGYSDPRFNQEKDLRSLAYAVGTMKSARERNLVSFYEFPYELMAQYIITGKIKFNPLPKSLVLQSRMAWGRPNNVTADSKIKEEELVEWNDLLDGYAQKYEYYLDTVFDGLVGKIFVM
jgi:hypothetical protein